MRALAILTVLVLAGCGADGEPEPQTSDRPVSGISISGDARIGVVGSP